MTAVIETQGLTKVYGGQTAVDNLTLEVNEGEIFGFLGPNGAGKTTSLLMLLGLTEPSQGQARVLGFDPVREPLKIKRQVGYLPENVGFYSDLTGRENLAYVARLNALDQDQAAQRTEEALDKVGLSGEGGKLAGEYSKGMRQRLGIAELLIKDPKLVFLDEPTVGLDPDGINKMLDLIVDLSKEQGISVLLSSHLLHQVQRICDRVGIMNKGSLVAVGAIEDLARQKMGDGQEASSLEEIYMRYFQEA
ncbi:MAG: ABC transporter ATP-binding protein [Deltaproteobacteria bacterium]|nr:ABC transporter ATP-binding protein [Deltaproteobacteria bacterium]